MRVGIMQPYFLPYVGYFQLLNHCDTFVIYDDIEYTKKGWITRNRFQHNGDVRLFSLNLKSDSDYLAINERTLAENFDRLKLLRSLESAYRKAPYFHELYSLLNPIVSFDSQNLFSYLENSITEACRFLEINTNIVKSSEIDIDPTIRGQDRVLEICKSLNAEEYVNPIGGLDLYDVASFKNRGINLRFIRSKLSSYNQGNFDFIPALSILDQIAFCGVAETRLALDNDFDLVNVE